MDQGRHGLIIGSRPAESGSSGGPQFRTTKSAGFRDAVQTKPLMPALGQVQHLRGWETRLFKAANRQGNRILEPLGGHEDDGPASCTKMLFQPSSGWPGSTPGFDFAFFAHDRRLRVNRTVREGCAGAALALGAGAGIDPPWFTGTDELYLPAGASRSVY